ncbi:extracellular ligand-binding receptor, partial [Corchorus olitorius]
MGGLLVGPGEAAQLLVATGDSGVQCLLGSLLAGPDLFGFLIDDGADLNEVAQADAARLVGGLADHLRHGGVGAGMLFVEARSLGQLVRSGGHGQVAGALVAGGLDLGVVQEVEEVSHALVAFGALASHHPQGSTADGRVLGGALHIGVVGQLRLAEGELAFLDHAGVQAGGARDHRALAGSEGGVGHVAAALVDEAAVLGGLGQVLEVLDVQRRVEHQLGIGAVKAVVLGRVQGVVPQREALQLGPAHPAR